MVRVRQGRLDQGRGETSTGSHQLVTLFLLPIRVRKIAQLLAKMAKKDGPPRSQEFIDDSDAALDEGSNDSDAKPKSSKGKKKAAESSDKKSSKVDHR